MRMLEGAKRVKMRPPSFYNSAFFEEKINELIIKSNIVSGGKCRLSLDRSSGGTFMPESNEVEYFIIIDDITRGIEEHFKEDINVLRTNLYRCLDNYDYLYVENSYKLYTKK